MEKPLIAVTMGDAAGVGPELIVKVLSRSDARERCRPIVVGDEGIMKQAIELTGAKLSVAAVRGVEQAGFRPGCLDVLRPPGMELPEHIWGRLDPGFGKAAALCLGEAYRLARQGVIDGVLSAPLNKEAFHAAGYAFRDELEYLADLTGSSETFILGLMGTVWTITVSEHVSFREIAGLVRRERVLTRIRWLHDALERLGKDRPRIAVAALNVHGGEGGLFGREEIDEIEPAVREARRRAVDVEGPFPADTVFVRATQGEFDGVVCMYHDQANIARKLHARRRGATIFMGLPVPCGTTAHGTAFDIAGQGVADPGSMVDALQATAALAADRDALRPSPR